MTFRRSNGFVILAALLLGAWQPVTPLIPSCPTPEMGFVKLFDGRLDLGER